MEKATQIELIHELLELQHENAQFLDERWEKTGPERYLSPDLFARERERISLALPQIVAHASELSQPGDFRTLDIAGRPVLLSRDETGTVRAFYNVCRHRGSRLVNDASGCRQRFSCPYHGWTWNNSGRLIGIPQEKSGFPGLDREEYGLHELHCEEYAGWIWMRLAAGDGFDAQASLGGMAADIEGMMAGDHVVFETTTREIAANWKLLVEGGLEAYHFRVAHKNTIAGLFCDNLSSYRCFGRHIRSVLPRATLAGLKEEPEAAWELGRHANVLYTLFPGSQFLVQEDHFIWIQGIPVAPDRTQLRLSTMIPRAEDTAGKQAYWQRNHQLTITTLDEDFALAEGIQQGLASGANTHLNFGRFEGALARFSEFVDDAIA